MIQSCIDQDTKIKHRDLEPKFVTGSWNHIPLRKMLFDMFAFI